MKKIIYDGPIFTVEQEGIYDFVRMKHKAVIVLAYDPAINSVAVIKEYRPIVDSFDYALPAGMIDESESIIDAAKREFKEETGYTLENANLFKTYYPSLGFTDQQVHVVFGVFDSGIQAEQQLDEQERISVELWKVDKFLDYKFIQASSIICQSFLLTLIK